MKTIPYLGLCLALVLTLAGCSSDDPLVLDPPTGLSASTDFALKVELSWDEVPRAEGYHIYRADYTFDLETAVFELIDSVEDATEYADITVNSSSEYYYWIEAYNGEVTSEPSDTVVGETITVTAEEAFDILAEYTGGTVYDAASALDVPEAIIQIINDNGNPNDDVVFLVDNTSSMSDDIYQVKQSISEIILGLPANVRLGMATYNDANMTSDWYTYVNLSTDYTMATAFLDNIVVFGGGDYPESVYDGIYLTLDSMSWASTSNRIIIVIGDAPPLEGRKTVKSLKNVVDRANELDIDVNLYPILIGG